MFLLLSIFRALCVVVVCVCVCVSAPLSPLPSLSLRFSRAASVCRMLLRSSSAPALSGLVPEAGGNGSPSLHKPFAASHLCNQPLFRIGGLSSNRKLSMRRACSESDLDGMVYSSTEADDQIRTGETKQHSGFSKLPIIQEKESQTTTSISECCLDKEEEFATSVRRCSCEDNKPTACSPPSTSSRGSAPCVHSIPPVEEGERVNPLLIANEVSISSQADQALLLNVSGDFYGCGSGRGSAGGNSGLSSSPHGDFNATDLYYQKLLQSDPENPLLLGNYAQFLCKAKHDYKKSEEYYERAILACPNDDEILSKYAKHLWDVHKDAERAGSYFDRAVKATADDCYVLASYADFLWQSEGDEDHSIKATQTAFCPLQEKRAAPSPLIASG